MQSTIDFVQRVNEDVTKGEMTLRHFINVGASSDSRDEELQKVFQKLKTNFGKGSKDLTDEELKRVFGPLERNETEYTRIWNAVDALQFIAVGVRLGIYDIDVVARLYGAWYWHVAREFVPVIEYARSISREERLFFYSEIQHVAADLLAGHERALGKAAPGSSRATESAS